MMPADGGGSSGGLCSPHHPTSASVASHTHTTNRNSTYSPSARVLCLRSASPRCASPSAPCFSLGFASLRPPRLDQMRPACVPVIPLLTRRQRAPLGGPACRAVLVGFAVCRSAWTQNDLTGRDACPPFRSSCGDPLRMRWSVARGEPACGRSFRRSCTIAAYGGAAHSFAVAWAFGLGMPMGCVPFIGSARLPHDEGCFSASCRQAARLHAPPQATAHGQSAPRWTPPRAP